MKPMQSQAFGLVWMGAAAVLVAAVALWARANRQPADTAEADTTAARTLAAQEDSAYRRRAARAHGSAHAPYSPGAPAAARSPRTGSTTSQHAAPPAALPAPYRRQPLLVDLNTADTLTLQLLHGIGPTYARRIVAYRERLGGFVSSSQLLEVRGIEPEWLARAAPALMADTAALRKLPLNSLGLKQLIRHPYVDYYLARDIVELRRQGIPIRSADDLRALPSMTDSALLRLLPYADFSVQP